MAHGPAWSLLTASRNPFGYQPWNQNRTFQVRLPLLASLPVLTVQHMFDILEADIVIMQETKIQRKDLRDDMVLVPGWDVFFSLPKHKKGTTPNRCRGRVLTV